MSDGAPRDQVEIEPLSPALSLLHWRETRDFDRYRKWCLERFGGYVRVGGHEFHPAAVLTLKEGATERARDDCRSQLQAEDEETICEQYPAPVAVPYQQFLNGIRDPIRRLTRMRDTWEGLIHLLSALALAEAVHVGVGNRPVMVVEPGSRHRIRARDLRSDRLSGRLGLIEGLLESWRESGVRAAVADLIAPGVINELRRLNAVRNGFSHLGTLSDSQARSLVAETAPLLRDSLVDLLELASVQLVRLLRVAPGSPPIAEVESLNGHAWSRRVLDLALDRDSEPVVLRAGRIGVYDRVLAKIGTRVVDLAPYFYACDDDSGHHTRVCFFKRRSEGKCVFEVVGEAVSIPSDATLHQSEFPGMNPHSAAMPEEVAVTSIAEQVVENGLLSCFKTIGIDAAVGHSGFADVERMDRASGVLTARLADAITNINPWLKRIEGETLALSVGRLPHPSLIENNRWFHGLLTNGVPVEYKDPNTGEMRGGRARLIDFDHPDKNDFLVVRQLTVPGPNGKTIRPDLVLYVNGLPLVVIELKDPANTAADLNVAIDQLGRYKTVAPDLFVPNLLLVASDGLLTRVGSITSGRQRFMPWRPAAGGEPTLEALIRELLNPAALLDYLRSCVAFEEDERGNIVKKVAGYHQFRAVRKARASVVAAIKTPDRKTDEAAGKGGVVWHTQGSGKSLTMLMLAGTLVRAAEMANPTVVIVTDRNDLDDQLFDTFAMGRALLRQDPVQADSREHLRQLLDRASGGVVFTTIHKFTEAHGTISERANIIVMADEAHRSQYGFVEGGARWMREALPNATFVGFTGTPLTVGDRVTRHVFGDYADVYDIRQSIADGATVPIYYEPRIVKLTIDEAGAKQAEAKIAEYATLDENGRETPENVRIPVEELYGAPERLERVAKFVVEHWEERRAAMEGKAMIVTMSRDIAARLYDEIREIRPGWHEEDDAKGVMKVIMTGGPDDPEHIAGHVRSKAQRKALADRFKDPADDFRVAIVVDMWLTGFDVPSAHTMYLDKPLAGHNLMQAIARVNRVYGDKPGGLIVDLIGLADPLADALAMYANATGETDKPVKELQDEAIPAMRSAFEQLQAFFHGYEYAAALEAEPENVLRVYLGAINHVLDVKQNVAEETGWQRFRGMVKRLATAFALAVPREETREIAPHLAFFQRVAAMIRKRLADEPGCAGGTDSGSRDIDAAVRQVIGGAVQAGEVIDLFAAAGLDAVRLDIFSDEFLERVSALEQKNLALETLRKLLNDQIKISERTNIVQAQKFREALEKAMLGYTNKQISTAQMIAHLLELAKWVREAKRQGDELGLSKEETAFYDALAENGSAKEVMKSDQLRLMARKLAEMVKDMPKLDWTQRESVRADLRRKVRRLLAMYGYPPDLSEDATQLVLKQAELSTEYAE